MKIAIYDGFSRIQVAILGVPVRPCAWEDEEHDHIKLFTWAFCEKIISRKNFEKKVFVLAQTQGKWLKIMLKIAWKMWKKWIFFDFSKWLLIIIYHRSSAPKCPPDFRELFLNKTWLLIILLLQMKVWKDSFFSVKYSLCRVIRTLIERGNCSNKWVILISKIFSRGCGDQVLRHSLRRNTSWKRSEVRKALGGTTTMIDDD